MVWSLVSISTINHKMENLSTLLTIALLLSAATLTGAARPEPAEFASFTISPADILSLVSHNNSTQT